MIKKCWFRLKSNKWFWFISLYVVSVIVVAGVAYLLQLITML